MTPAIAPPGQPSLLAVLARRPTVWFGLLGTVVAALVGIVLTRGQLVPLTPPLSQVPAFTFTSQDGAPFGTDDLKGQVWVANFIFTRCPTFCPAFTAKMKAIQERSAGEAPGLQLVSISVDPAHDSPEKLKAYAAKHGADTTRWTFLNGPREALEEVVVRGMLQPLEDAKDEDLASLVHGSYFVLVDRQLNVRGFFRFNEPGAVDEVLKLARALLQER